MLFSTMKRIGYKMYFFCNLTCNDGKLAFFETLSDFGQLSDTHPFHTCLSKECVTYSLAANRKCKSFKSVKQSVMYFLYIICFQCQTRDFNNRDRHLSLYQSHGQASPANPVTVLLTHSPKFSLD